MLNKAYVEITNRCNLRCCFCPGTKRAARTMSCDEFAAVARALRGHVKFLYLHVMGEPLTHPQLSEILSISAAAGFSVCITTNGTLLAAHGGVLLAAENLHKVSISLHAPEGSGCDDALSNYLSAVWDFCTAATAKGVYCALRLWNEGGAASRNGEILDFLQEKTGVDPRALPRTRSGSRVLGPQLFLEQAQEFDWPSLDKPSRRTEFCFGLRDQLGILVDGTVVPCCLDCEGEIALGNIFKTPLEEILHTARAEKIYDGFSNRQPAEELCRRCGYATRFNKG